MTGLRLRMTALGQCTAVLLLGVVIWSVVASIASEDIVSNQIHVIAPYRQASTWVFDDPAVGLKAEPFVSGIPQMIDALVQDIPRADRGFRLLFSAHRSPAIKSNWYACGPNTAAIGTAGLRPIWKDDCAPALGKYFPEPPPTLYARAEGL